MAAEPAYLYALDLAGVGVFALSGGSAGMRARLDIFGVVVLAMVTALGGGFLRDTALGRTPPFALQHWPFLLVSAVAGIVVFYWHPKMRRCADSFCLPTPRASRYSPSPVLARPSWQVSVRPARAPSAC